jgi:hypothetical protein
MARSIPRVAAVLFLSAMLCVASARAVPPTLIVPPTGTTIVIGSVSGERSSQRLPIAVTVETMTEVDGVFHGIVFGPEITMGTSEHGLPDCEANRAIDKYTAFQLVCHDSGVCRLTAVLGSSPRPVSPPIPSGSLLYTCYVVITEGAVAGLSYPLSCHDATAVEADGTPLPAGCVDGQVIVSEPSPTAVPTFTISPSPTPSATSVPVLDDDGCSVGSSQTPASSLILLIPIGALIVVRCRPAA